jgi:hypothetical protein
MRNLKHEKSVWIFKIHGPGCASQLFHAVTILGPPAVIMAIAFFAISAVFATTWAMVWKSMTLLIVTYVAVIAMLLAFAKMANLVSAGLGARYEVHIDRNAQKAIARDRLYGETLWESPYDPAKLHLAHTRMRSRSGSYLQPVLVYGDAPDAVVKYTAPTERQTVLTIATRYEIERLIEELGQTADDTTQKEPSSPPASTRPSGGGLLVILAAVFGTILAAILLGQRRKE